MNYNEKTYVVHDFITLVRKAIANHLSDYHKKEGYMINFDGGGNPKIDFGKYVMHIGSATFTVSFTDPEKQYTRDLFDELDRVHDAIVYPK